MSSSTYLDSQLLGAALTGNTYTGNATVYAALYSTAPTANTSGTELSGNGYSRQSVAFSVANSVATSTGNVTFSATGNAWSTAVALAITDASSSGNILFYNTLTPTKTLQAGDTFTFGTGNITVTLS